MPERSRLQLLRHRLKQQLWWRPAVWSLAAIAAASASALADAYVPVQWLPKIDYAVVDDLLRIMASTMLAVSTFALSVLVSAYASAASAGTPRATQLVVAEPRSQKAVAVFLAAFIFSMVGVIALGTGRYGAAGRLALFACALGVLAWVVVSFMSYIDVISRIGRVSHTITTVEKAAAHALNAFMRQPLGGASEADGPPPQARPVTAEKTGHAQFVDVEALQKLAEDCGGRVHVTVRAGDLVHPRTTLAWLQTGNDDKDPGERDAAVRKAFVIGAERTIEQDAAYGLIVLCEIAQRALSPGINDPGTAIAVLGSQTRLLIQALQQADDLGHGPPHDRVSTTPVHPVALVAIAYAPIARCSTAQFDVMQQLLRHLDALVQNSNPAFTQAARELVQRVLAFAERDGADSDDLARWKQQAQALAWMDAAEPQ